MDPKVRWLEVFGIAFVFVRAIAGLTGCPFPGDKIDKLVVESKNVSPAAWTVKLWKEPGPNIHPCTLPRVSTYCFCWEVERREHSKAPTTKAMMMKPPTDTMMTITKMWFSPPVIPNFPLTYHNYCCKNSVSII